MAHAKFIQISVAGLSLRKGEDLGLEMVYALDEEGRVWRMESVGLEGELHWIRLPDTRA